MSGRKDLRDACAAIGFVLLMISVMVGAAEIITLKNFPGTEAVVVNASITSTAEEAVAAAAATELANSPYGHGYDRNDYMASPTLDDPADGVNWYFGEGAAD